MHVDSRLGREKMELGWASPAIHVTRVRGEPTRARQPTLKLIRTLGDDPGAESVMRSITESFGSIERLVCQCGSCFVGGGGTKMSDLQTVCQKPRGQCRSEEQGGQSGS